MRALEKLIDFFKTPTTLRRKRDGKRANAYRPVVGHVPRKSCLIYKPSAPVRVRTSYRGYCVLEVQQNVNHHSRYNVSQRKRRNVPQEVPHGVASFREARPTRPQPTHSHYSRQERTGANKTCSRADCAVFAPFNESHASDSLERPHPATTRAAGRAWGEGGINHIAYALSHFFNKFRGQVTSLLGGRGGHSVAPLSLPNVQSQPYENTKTVQNGRFEHTLFNISR